MDWFQILIILLFFLFPLIQQGIEAARRSGEPEMPFEAEDDEELEWADEAERARTATLPHPRQEDGAEEWSSGWLDWPSPEVEGETEQRIPRQVKREVEPAPAPVPARAPGPEPRLEDAPWALPPEAPAIPRPTRQPPTSFGKGTELAPVDRAPEVVRGVTKSRPPADPRVSHRSRTPLGGALASRSALRQAVVLHEVLGPPIAFRERGDRPS